MLGDGRKKREARKWSQVRDTQISAIIWESREIRVPKKHDVVGKTWAWN
jgi:hypothetical protein